MTYLPKTVLASRPAAMLLALSLVAGLTTPFLMLPRAQAAGSPPPLLPCTVNNHNGCTELSATPPEDTLAVPPNLVLMLDNSSSMGMDYTPDACYMYGVTCTGTTGGTNPLNGNPVDVVSTFDPLAVIDPNNNGMYYDPTVIYTPPPQADSTPYPSYSDITNVPIDGFIPTRLANPGACPTGYANLTSYPNNSPDHDTKCKMPSEASLAGEHDTSTKTFSFSATVSGKQYFRYSTDTNNGQGPYTAHYVATSAEDCVGVANCVVDTDTSGVAAPAGIAVGTNVANWFAYYHSRILTARTGLMKAFDHFNPRYRFGYGAINLGNAGTMPVHPFGTAADTRSSDGTWNTASQRYKFWQWLTKNPSGGTPLRSALQSVGAYYQEDGPWQSMAGDPGYTSSGSNTPLACRAAYAILTTDGFWNGDSTWDTAAPTGITGADDTAGATYTDPLHAGHSYGYTPVPPFSDSFSDVPSLADVAMYYWKTDLQPDIKNEVPAPTDGTGDPAFWQHMVTFTVGLGVTPYEITPLSDPSDPSSVPTRTQIFAWAQAGGGTASIHAISGFSWPTPGAGRIANIADLEHAAVNGHGDFFNAKKPDQFEAAFDKAIADINQKTVNPTASAVNTSVATTGALSFATGYSTGDWSGTFQAVVLKDDGSTTTTVEWDAGNGPLGNGLDGLDATYHTPTGFSSRTVYSDAYTYDASTSTSTLTPFQFNAANVVKLDASEQSLLMTPAVPSEICTTATCVPAHCNPWTGDTVALRIDYLLGDPCYEGTAYRPRSHLLGAILRAQPVYVASASSGYTDNWPANSPEAATGAQTYDNFVTQETSRPGTVYIGANDGMLHAFAAPTPVCTAGSPPSCTYGNGGKELWSFIPRAVYANLGNLTDANMVFRPTVDATPVTRDVFFSSSTGPGSTHVNHWRTLLTGGLGLGGRGVYALDITDPTTFGSSDVLWEFDSDMDTAGCVSNSGACQASDLGYTMSQPNIGRLALTNSTSNSSGTWVVLVPNGYFPDCSMPDTPTNDTTNCQAVAAQAPQYSALFVLNAQTGEVIAELKTPSVAGVTSFGLATPVMGDYDNDQVDDVAFAGDVEGNLWRFDLRGTTAATWKVTLVYKGLTDSVTHHQGVQPITTMPRLFPDPTTNNFMVVFGTGRYLGVGDNSAPPTQAIYGIRDPGNTTSSYVTHNQLVQQTLDENILNSSTNPYAGATVRTLTNNSVPASKGGWYIKLYTSVNNVQTDSGERVVVTPAALFASNTVVVETMITGGSSSDPCDPSIQGALMAINAETGGAGEGVSSLGGGNVVGARIGNVRTSGNLPIVSAFGGGAAYPIGPIVTGTAGNMGMSLDSTAWRRRSWSEIIQKQ